MSLSSSSCRFLYIKDWITAIRTNEFCVCSSHSEECWKVSYRRAQTKRLKAGTDDDDLCAEPCLIEGILSGFFNCFQDCWGTLRVSLRGLYCPCAGLWLYLSNIQLFKFICHCLIDIRVISGRSVSRTLLEGLKLFRLRPRVRRIGLRVCCPVDERVVFGGRINALAKHIFKIFFAKYVGRPAQFWKIIRQPIVEYYNRCLDVTQQLCVVHVDCLFGRVLH